MAYNVIGFVPKKYRQPDYYKELFLMWNAVYLTDDGREYHVQARPHFLSSNYEGARIENLELLVQCSDCRRKIGEYKTFKACFEALERRINKT